MAGVHDLTLAGHFFFEPKGYDHLNQATHEHKEEIKVGYNPQRKVVLMTIWALSPLVLYFDPTPSETAGPGAVDQRGIAGRIGVGLGEVRRGCPAQGRA